MKVDFEKMGGLVPAIVQDSETKTVLMLGYMNQEALDKTLATKKVTFWSRSRNELWTKGETSGNFLNLVSIESDCDNDALLVKAIPDGPTCHLGTDTCWGETNEKNPILFLSFLQDFINKRHEEMPEGSYTTSLFKKGVNKMAQKVGEEALETVIEATNGTNEHLRRFRHALPSARIAHFERAAHRRPCTGTGQTSRPELGPPAASGKGRWQHGIKPNSNQLKIST